MTTPFEYSFAYYAAAAPMSDPRAHRTAFAELSADASALCRVIQGALIHREWTAAYGWKLPADRRRDAQARSTEATLDRIFALDPRPLSERRPPEKRFAGTCRDFTLMLTAMLRARGVPARARCGFGRYFGPGLFGDHWVCERWDAASDRWVLTDAQIDDLQREALKLDFDPLDVPRDRFIVAGEGWALCRTGREDPMRFGIFDVRGLWFVFGNVLRDLAALNKVEVLPWDDFGAIRELSPPAEPSDALAALADRVAALVRDPDRHFDAIRAAYAADPSVRVGATVRNWETQADEPIRTA